MHRLPVLCLLLIAIAGLTLGAAPSAQAYGFCGCGPLIQTPTLSSWGQGCAQAQANLEAALYDYVTCIDCSVPVLVSSCTRTTGEDPFYIATGYLRYRCWVLSGGCQIP